MAHVLVVDEDPVTRLVVKTLLTDAGHTVVLAGEGGAGLRAMAERVPDLVITELFISGDMEGMEFLRRIRERWPGEPILVMSSKDRLGAATLLRIAELLGAVGFLDKPIRDRQLLETVGAIVAA